MADASLLFAEEALTMRANDVRSGDMYRHGAYVCVRARGPGRAAVAAAPVAVLAERVGLVNEFEAVDGDPPASVAFLRRLDAVPGARTDDGLLQADAVVHVAAPTAAPVTEFCAELTRLLGSAEPPRILQGGVRPVSYTGNAMHNFAYAHRVLQQPGRIMPNAFLIPMSKTAAWWAKDWMERHTYFLPRYDEAGRMVNEGHALAAAPGVPCLLRRTYKHASEPAPADAYDFVTYFECRDADVPTFQAVCAALRDVTKNPEWAFVREGPTWHGRRVGTWAELFA
jgi:hypothetical protein